MSLRVLMDAHISPDVAAALRLRGIDALAMQEWRGGDFLFSSDHEILHAAYEDGRVFITYDVGSIPALVRVWGLTGVAHAGVVYISRKTIRQNQFGALTEAVAQFVSGEASQDWLNRVDFLRRRSP